MERARTRNLWVFDKTDSFEWFLALGPLSNVNARYLKGQAPSWNLFVQHPNLDWYWEKEMCGVLPFITGLPVPALNVLGWFDAEDFVGPLKVYRKLEEFDGKGGAAERRRGVNRNYLVIGPWTHGSWTSDDTGERIGAIEFASATSKYFREQIQLPWFEYWLKDRGTLDMPEVRAFQTGSNIWESFDAWPPAGTRERKLYLHAGGRLSFDPPSESGEAFDSYVSDPAHPVPYRHRPIRGGIGWPQWQLEDQRLAHLRPDVLTFVSDTLTEDITVTGDVVAKLFASTTGSDSDWIVKLIDVFPEPHPTRPEMGGYQMMVAGEVFRAKFRNDYRVPEAVVPGKVTPYSINLRDRNHRFQRGHRLMVQIQSTWFPLIDRNPQKFLPSIFEARAEDFQSATQRVYRSREAPTHLVLPVR
jgi:putative CocE/NonD family hydrolase